MNSEQISIRDVAGLYRGEKGKGKVAWEDLANPFKQKKGIGMGGSQKAEVAYSLSKGKGSGATGIFINKVMAK